MRQENKFWNRLAKLYAARPVANQEAYQKKLRITQKYLHPDMRVLEFGCGTGSTAIAHAPLVKHIEAIDFSNKMLDIARNKANAKNISNVTFKQSGIEEFEGDDQEFDVVMGHSILHLLDNKEKVISKVHRMLKPGGIFVSSTTCLGSKLSIFRLILPVGHFIGLLPLVRFFDAQGLENSIRDAGFDIDYKWQPDKDSAIFIVAKKAA